MKRKSRAARFFSLAREAKAIGLEPNVGGQSCNRESRGLTQISFLNWMLDVEQPPRESFSGLNVCCVSK
jgi:hypothetical protein